MDRYYVNTKTDNNPSNDHEVHKVSCPVLPSSRTDLGVHDSCERAIKAAATMYDKVDGCATCIPECHNS